MNKLYCLLFFVFSIQGFSQDSSNFYFAGNGMQVENEDEASKAIKLHEISKKKFELLEYKKFRGSWKKQNKKTEVSIKDDQTYIVSVFYRDEFKSDQKIEIIRETENGFLIREYDGKFCVVEAEVSNLFPRVYNGDCTFYTKEGPPRKTFFYKNLEYQLVEQPGLLDVVLPENKADMPARYPKGIIQFVKDVVEKTNFPEDIDPNELKERFLLSMTIDSTGNLINAHFIGRDETAITKALLKACAANEIHWYPASLQGGRIDFDYLIPFSLSVENEKANDQDRVLTVVEKMPQYPGGEAKLKRDIAMEVKYPVVAQERGIQGKVFVSFVVDTEGNIRDVKIARGVHPSLDMEAIRVVKSLSRWIPGEQDGKTVCVSYTVPINFILTPGNNTIKNTFGRFPANFPR